MADSLVPILILAAGRSSRMAPRDKLLEDVDGITLLRRTTQRALSTGQPAFVATAPDHEKRRTVLKDLTHSNVIVESAAEGMSATMRDAVPHLPTCSAFMLLLADLPDLTADDLQEVIAARTNHPDFVIWRGGTKGGQPGHPVIFDAKLRDRFNVLTGDGGGEGIAGPLRDQTHLTLFDDDRARRDLDTPKDWTTWRAAQ